MFSLWFPLYAIRFQNATFYNLLGYALFGIKIVKPIMGDHAQGLMAVVVPILEAVGTGVRG